MGPHGELMNRRDGSICFIDFLYAFAINTNMKESGYAVLCCQYGSPGDASPCCVLHGASAGLTRAEHK